MCTRGVEVVKQVGVLLVEGQHGVLSDMVRDVLEHAPCVELVGRVTETGHTMRAVERTACDAVVWIVPRAEDAVAPPDLLEGHPRLRILAVEGHGQKGSLWQMRPHRKRIDTLSPEGIVEELLREP